MKLVVAIVMDCMSWDNCRRNGDRGDNDTEIEARGDMIMMKLLERKKTEDDADDKKALAVDNLDTYILEMAW